MIVLGQIIWPLVQLLVRDILGSSKKLANLLTKNLRPVTSLEVEGKSLMAKQDQKDKFKKGLKGNIYVIDLPEDQSY